MKTSFRYSSNPELSGITLDVINISNQSAVPGIADDPLLRAVKDTHAPFHEAVLREPTTRLGKELGKLNRKRIKTANALRSLLRQITKFSNTVRSAPAAAILKEWDMQVNPISGNDYDEVNAYMNKLIALLKSDGLKPHFEALMLTDAVTDVETADAEFQTLYLEQTLGNAELRRRGSATQHRAPLEKALGNYLKFITVMRGQPGYDVLYSKLNETIKTAKKASKKQPPDEGEAGK